MTLFFWKRFIGTWFIASLTLQLTRAIFYFNLIEYFDGDFSEIFSAFLFGFEFDAVTIAYLLGPFFIALPFIKHGWSKTLAKWFFLIMLGAMNFLNCADAEFFKFIARRSTDDLFEFAFLSNDIFNIAPELISHFWYLLVGFVLTMLLALWLIEKVLDSESEQENTWKRFTALVPTALALIIAARGGFHSIPLSIIDAGKTDVPHLSALTLSTPFTIIKTIGKPELPRYEFAENERADIQPVQLPRHTSFSGNLKGANVVLIIVESLGSEYISSLNGKGSGYTPFIDSLIDRSFLFENGFANGHRSIEGIAAATSAIPTLMYEPYSTSRYAGNKFSSLANLLGEEGYYTSFMHGGNKNSMNFESFTGLAGYDLFYDREDYPFPDKHYDGVWGISDHYMLNHCVEKFSEFNTPFFSTIFTLSSHHPYTIPEAYQNRFPKGTLPIHESLGYSDAALKEFFLAASKEDWYGNTLFVITADHTSLSEYSEFQTKLGALKIPFIFYHPSDSLLRGKSDRVMQQIDVMPTILELLGHEKPFFSFGVSAFDEQADHISVAFKHDQHQLYRNGQLICFDGEKTNFVYNVSEDELLQNNLVNNANVDFSENEAFLKAYLQNYSVALNDNRMTYQTWTGNN